MRSSTVRFVRSAVLRWARGHDRRLPWRGERDPYRVLVSEVMLQQTQAARVAEAYPSFVRRFPSVGALAAARPATVLRAWEGLGYNRRALSLWRAAGVIDARGSFPRTIPELEALPGVGPYTARAVASFAWGDDAAVVDVNVRRVLTRFLGLAPGSEVQRIADRLLPPGRAPAWNQALMDLGSGVCRPRNPACERCPLRRRCRWAAGERPHGERTASPGRPPFEETRRYARGRVVAALRRSEHGVAESRLPRLTGLDPRRVADAVAALERDGLVTRSGATVALGPASEAGARRATGPVPGACGRRE